MFLKISDSGHEGILAIHKEAKTAIALIAQEAAHLARRMAVVDY